MMAAAQRDDEFVAHLAPERRMLREPKVMGVRGPAPTNQTGLFGHEFDVVLVPKPTRLGIARARSYRCRRPWMSRSAAAVAAARGGWLGSDDDKGALSHLVALPRVVILPANASSTCRASAATRLFFAAMIRCAHIAAASAERRSRQSVRSCRAELPILRVEDWFGNANRPFHVVGTDVAAGIPRPPFIPAILLEGSGLLGSCVLGPSAQ